MSKYEDYSKASDVYDFYRIPFGSKDIKRSLYYHFKGNLSKVHLLDAACGTGNHSFELLEDKDINIGKITLLDGNQGMLDQAKAKLSDHNDRISTVLHVLPNLPFSPECFDAIMCNFAIHHIENSNVHGFQVIKTLLKEFYKALKPGGIVFITSVTMEQLDSFWYNDHRIQSFNGFKSKLIPTSILCEHSKEAGFTRQRTVVPINETIMSEKNYFDYDGPFRKEWRDSLSGYALLSESETERMLERLRIFQADTESWEKFKEEIEKRRMISGQGYVFSAIKD